jgi:hypothetical protein
MRKLEYVSFDKDRHGQRRCYVRRNGRRVRIRERPGSPAFVEAVARALRKLERPEAIPSAIHGPKQGTLWWLVELYFASPEFQNLQSQRRRRAIFERCLSVVHHGTGKEMRHCPLNQLSAAKIKAIRDAATDTPGAANKRLQYLSAMFGWAVENGKIQSNPAATCGDLNTLVTVFTLGPSMKFANSRNDTQWAARHAWL